MLGEGDSISLLRDLPLVPRHEIADRFIQLTSPRSAMLKGFKMMFAVVQLDRGSPEVRANIIESDPQSSVEGVVYRLSKATLEYLDFKASNSSRRSVKVIIKEKDKESELEAQAYVAASTGKVGFPTRDYLLQMLDGAREYGLSKEYIQILEEQVLKMSRAAASTKPEPTRTVTQAPVTEAEPAPKRPELAAVQRGAGSTETQQLPEAKPASPIDVEEMPSRRTAAAKAAGGH